MRRPSRDHRERAVRSCRATILCVLALLLVLSAQAQEPVLRNLQLLACQYSPQLGKLILAMMSISSETDPKKGYFKDEVEVRLHSGKETTSLVGHGELSVAALNDYRGALDGRHTLFRISIVMDESGSIDDQNLEIARQTIDHFLKNLPGAFEVQLIRFTDQPEVLLPFSKDREALHAALQSPRITGGTAFFDALDQAQTELRQSEDGVPLRFVVAFTDGQDTSSRRFEDAAAFKVKINRIATEEQIPIFLAGIGNGINDTLLSQLGGPLGFYYHLQSVPEVDKMFAAVANVVEKTYIVGIPISSAHTGLTKVEIVRSRTNSRQDLIQDLILPDACIPR